MRRRRAIALLALLAFASACTEHRVGPARTADDYERKARTTRVGRDPPRWKPFGLLAELSSAGKSFGAFTSVALSEQEDSLAAARADFESIQPPGDGSDDIRDELVPLLDAAMDHVATVRIAARRGELSDLADIGAPASH